MKYHDTGRNQGRDSMSRQEGLFRLEIEREDQLRETKQAVQVKNLQINLEGKSYEEFWRE